MARNALYFPYINVPNNTWFSCTLLYWDKVTTITPYSVARDSNDFDPHTRSLIQSELLELIFPPHATEMIYSEFVNEFSTYLESLGEDEINFRREAFKNGVGDYIHIDKLGFLKTKLLTMGLCKNSPGPWVFTELKTANEFMSALAACIAAKDQSGMQPVTDNIQNIKLFLPNEDLGRLSMEDTRIQILKDAFPIPSRPITAEDIQRFKAKYGNLLSAFRSFIETELLNISSETDENRKAYRLSELKRRVKEESASIKKYLDEQGILAKINSDFCALFDKGAGLADFASGKPVGLLGAIAKVFKKNNPLSNSPLTYAGFAQHELGLDIPHPST